MRTATLIAIVVGCGIVAAIVWLALGSRILLVADRWFPGRPSANSVDVLLIDAGRFGIGPRWYPMSGSPAYRLIVDSRKRLALCALGRTFAFGPVQEMWTDPVNPQYRFVPEAGDRVSFTREVSRLSWQTPFAFSVMGSKLPKWHRYAYDRLRWIKGSGTVLEIVWRDEQAYYSPQWTDKNSNRLTDWSIGLGPIEKAASAYLEGTKGWAPGEYRLETQPEIAEDHIVAAIYAQDEAGGQPGGGKSVVLRVNKLSGRVAGESGFQ